MIIRPRNLPSNARAFSLDIEVFDTLASMP